MFFWTVVIFLKHGEAVLIDDDDFDLVSAYNWYRHKEGYAVAFTQTNGRKYYLLMHRLILDVPKGKLTDHINRNRLDNRRSNLRIVNQRQNQGNAWWNIPGKSSKFKGVTWCKKNECWIARLKTTEANSRKRSIYLGSFAKEVDAAKAYNAAAGQHFGEHVWLNPVP